MAKMMGMHMEDEWIYLTKLGLWETAAIVASRPEMRFYRANNRITVTWFPENPENGVIILDQIAYRYFDYVFFDEYL